MVSSNVLSIVLLASFCGRTCFLWFRKIALEIQVKLQLMHSCVAGPCGDLQLGMAFLTPHWEKILVLDGDGDRVHYLSGDGDGNRDQFFPIPASPFGEISPSPTPSPSSVGQKYPFPSPHKMLNYVKNLYL